MIPKFRAWDEQGFMLDVENIVKLNLEEEILEYCVLNEYGVRSDRECCFDEVIFMQYTGLFDKNGKEIFEGDILKTDNNHKFEVIWDSSRFIGVDNVRDGSGYICYVDSHYKDGKSCLEVLGNVYENAELLEVEL